MKTPCPCKSSSEYKVCCEPYHNGKQSAPTAEALMRSRYSAYALQLPRYLFKTWHKATRPTLQQLSQHDNIQWVSLKIKKTELGREQDTTGIVAFTATFVQHDKIEQLTERSYFERVQGKWVYVDGENNSSKASINSNEGKS